jgi:SAM-dependent methyltransferase
MTTSLFDLSSEYDALLNQGLKLSGEDKWYFIDGRLRELLRRVPAGWRPRRVLDFGCGIGATSSKLADLFPEATIVGVDTSEAAIAHAAATFGCERLSFGLVSDMPVDESFDLCYVNGVFHHIEPSARVDAVARIRRALAPGGYFGFFENNPWNPGTMAVMRLIPFDRDAKPLSMREARRLCLKGGFQQVEHVSFLFYFPRSLALLRFMEPWLVRVPMGGQYLVLAVK